MTPRSPSTNSAAAIRSAPDAAREGPDQVIVTTLVELRQREDAFAADHPSGIGDACAVDDDAQRAESRGDVERGGDGPLICDVAGREGATEL